MQWLLTLGVLAMIWPIETLISPGWCMIGRWTPSMFCILLEGIRRAMIDFVGRPHKEDLFEVKS